jgi:hypothetical protein
VFYPLRPGYNGIYTFEFLVWNYNNETLQKNWYVQEKTSLKKAESLKMNPGTGTL